MADAKKASLLDDFRRVSNPATVTLFLSSLLVPMAAFMLYPFLIIYFTHVLRLSVAAAGFLLSVRFLSSGFLGFLGGALSERIGLGRTYLAAGVVTGLTVWALGMERQVWVLACLLVVLGVSASTVNAMARGLANEHVDEESGGIVQNYIHWLNNVGMAAALPISAFLLGGGYSRIPFDVTAVAYAALALVLGIAFRGSGTSSHDAPKPTAKRAMPWTILAEDRAFLWLIVSFLLVVIVEMQFESGVPLDLSFHFAHGAKLFGTLGILDMAVVFVLQLVVSHWLAQRKSPWYGYLGMLAVGGLIVGGLWQSVAGWTLSVLLLAVGDVFAYGQIFSMMGKLPKPGRQGSYFSILGMAQGLGTFAAYGFGAAAYQGLKPGWMFGLCLPAAVLATVAFRNARRAADGADKTLAASAG